VHATDSLSCTCRRPRHRRFRNCSAAAIALTASLCRTRHQRHLTRTRSLSLTLRAVAARVFAHRLGAPAASLVLFSLSRHLDTARSRLSMLRRLSRSQRHHPLRRAAKARRSLASAVADRRADGKNAFDPAATLHLTAAVFATRPPPASSAGSPRPRGALERPKHKDCRVSLGLARVVLRLGLEVAHRHDVRVRITSRARVKLGLHAPPPRLEEGLKSR
jgi:hypothetical protein